jgi:hypothetical protein
MAEHVCSLSCLCHSMTVPRKRNRFPAAPSPARVSLDHIRSKCCEKDCQIVPKVNQRIVSSVVGSIFLVRALDPLRSLARAGSVSRGDAQINQLPYVRKERIGRL